MPDLREEFEAHLKAMPDWAPEFEVHRPWVEKLLLDTWNTATERAAKKEPLTEEQVRTLLPKHIYSSWNHMAFVRAIEAAHGIRAREGKGGAG